MQGDLSIVQKHDIIDELLDLVDQVGGDENRLLFGSELKALVVHGGWSPEIDRDSLASYMRHMVVPAPASIYQGIHKLEPG